MCVCVTCVCVWHVRVPDMGVTQAEYRKEMDEMRAAKKEAQEQAKEGYQVKIHASSRTDCIGRVL